MFKIRGRTKTLIALRWNWNSLRFLTIYEIVLAKGFNLTKLVFWKIEKFELVNESYNLFFQEDALIIWKTWLSINLTLKIKIEWIKYFQVDKNTINDRPNFKSF